MSGIRTDQLRIYTQHRAALVDYASAITGDTGLAEDVVQEAWLRVDGVNENISSHPVREPVRYLYRIVRNLAIDVRRSFVRNPAQSDGALDISEIVVADDRPNPEEALIASRELQAVAAAFAQLPERTRLAIRLHRLEGRPLREVADRLGISITRAHGLVASGIADCDRHRHSVIRKSFSPRRGKSE